MKASSSLDKLIDALRLLPGVGPKTAQRMAFHLLQNDRSAALQLASALETASANVLHCARCHTFTETEICATCANEARDPHLLCVVETPADQMMIEQTLTFKGLYFVLMGHLSPLDGVLPKDLHLEQLLERASDGVVTEVVLATNFTSEGEATAHYISQILKARGLHVSRLARGVPIGGELEYVDAGTIARAMLDRRST